MTDDVEYKKLELLIRYGRENLLDRILHYKEMFLSVEGQKYLIDEILYLYKNGCPSLDDLSDKELAEELIDYLERGDYWYEELERLEENGL